MLIKRVYETDPLECPCGGQMKMIAFIEPPQGAVIEKILRHCDLLNPRRRAQHLRGSVGSSLLTISHGLYWALSEIKIPISISILGPNLPRPRDFTFHEES